MASSSCGLAPQYDGRTRDRVTLVMPNALQVNACCFQSGRVQKFLLSGFRVFVYQGYNIYKIGKILAGEYSRAAFLYIPVMSERLERKTFCSYIC